MYLRELGLTLLRRWYFVVIGLLITGGLTYLVFDEAPISYSATASAALLPPSSVVGPGGNPFLYMGGLNQALDILSKSLTSDQSRQDLLGDRTGYEFDAGQDHTTSGPILLITAEAPTPAGALATMQAVLDSVPTTLQSLQVDLNVPPASRITSAPLTVAIKPTLISKTRTQYTGIFGVAGLAMTLLFTGLLDGILVNRRTRRAAKILPDAEQSSSDIPRAIPEVPAPIPELSVGQPEAFKSSSRLRPGSESVVDDNPVKSTPQKTK
ncbi:hypothetical protein [Specibacter sp. NPDC078692]|uniref:hypothetical protein n=1 Tax=Specibacter sp. NPDC078692 TaxID=3155818 RepID=UPI00341B677E